MNRCAPGRRRAAAMLAALPVLAASLLSVTLPSTASAQDGAPPGHRVFPAQALRGELTVTAWPEVRLNDQIVRLAPGARLRGPDNLLRPPASLTGQTLLVHYTVEATTGLLMEMWVLSAVERENTPWPASAEQARTWRFNPTTQKWSRP